MLDAGCWVTGWVDGWMIGTVVFLTTDY